MRLLPLLANASMSASCAYAPHSGYGALPPTPEESRIAEYFGELATPYYVAGRAAAMADVVPVYGNLLHHALKLYLKAALIRHVPVKALGTREYGQ